MFSKYLPPFQDATVCTVLTMFNTQPISTLFHIQECYNTTALILIPQRKGSTLTHLQILHSKQNFLAECIVKYM